MLNYKSHGVFVDTGAAKLWRDHYLAALRLDVAGLNMAGIRATRKRWREAALANPQVLFTRIGPEIPCKVLSVKVKLVALWSESPVRFDINTVQAGILRLIPGISEAEVSGWLEQRVQKPFASEADFRSRAGLSAATLAKLRF